MLDAEEYFRLAVHASASGDCHACIGYLNETLRLQPRHAHALYLLAVQHAEIGLVERAIAGIRAALDAGLGGGARDMALLQLGLLLLFDNDRPVEAREQLSAVSGEADPAVRQFAAALMAFAGGDTQQAINQLRLGQLQKSQAGAALAPLMQRLIDRLAENGTSCGAKRGARLGADGRG